MRKTKHKTEDLEEIAMDAIKDVFNDTSVSQAECKRRLQDLIDEIEMLIDTLKDDE